MPLRSKPAFFVCTLLTLATLNFFSSWLKAILAKKSISTVIYSIITESWHWKVLSEKSRPKSKYAALALANAKPLQTSGQAATIIHGNLDIWIWESCFLALSFHHFLERLKKNLVKDTANTFAWRQLWNFIVFQVKFNTLLNLNEHAQRIFWYLVNCLIELRKYCHFF